MTQNVVSFLFQLSSDHRSSAKFVLGCAMNGNVLSAIVVQMVTVIFSFSVYRTDGAGA
jgi:hypothetical protein